MKGGEYAGLWRGREFEMLCSASSDCIRVSLLILPTPNDPNVEHSSARIVRGGFYVLDSGLGMRGGYEYSMSRADDSKFFSPRDKLWILPGGQT